MGLPYLPGLKPWTNEVHKTASYTVLQSDTGTLFVADSGTDTFTLPTLALAGAGGFVGYFYNVSASAMAITAPAGKLICFNNAAGTTATYSSAGKIIGAFCCIWLNDPGTFYHHVNLSASCPETIS